MSFIASFFASLIEYFVSHFIVEKVNSVESDERIKSEAQTDAENLKKAISPEETAKTLSDIERHTFHD